MRTHITREAFERALVRNAAATLLGAKPASLFTFRGAFACDCARRCRDRGADGSAPARIVPCEGVWDAGAAPDEAAVRMSRRELMGAAGRCARDLAPAGVRLRVLAWRPFGALVYVYRPNLLCAHLSDVRIRRALVACGYKLSYGLSRRDGDGGRAVGHGAETDAAARGDRDAQEVEGLLAQLRRRFETEGLPHDMGFFLGYPYEDVAGFIRHEGRDFICFGCWKVYADARGAWRRFRRYKRCARRCERLFGAGMGLAQLAAPPGSGGCL